VEPAPEPAPEPQQEPQAAASAPSVSTIWIKTFPVKGASPQYVNFSAIIRAIIDILRKDGATIVTDDIIAAFIEERGWAPETPVYVCAVTLAAYPRSVFMAIEKSDIVYQST